MNTYHNWVNTFLIVVGVVILVLVGGNQPAPVPVQIGGSTDDNWSVGGNLTVTGTSSFATTTVTRSFDGWVERVGFTVATGTAQMVITNNTGTDWVCHDGAINANAVSPGYSPPLEISMGTSTSATGEGLGLLASTTLATSSDKVIELDAYTVGGSFVLAATESIVAIVLDGTDFQASSTNFANWTIESAFDCRLIGT